MEGEIRKGSERQVCHRVNCKDYERKECIYGGQETVEQKYSPALIHTDMWIRFIDLE